IDMEAQLRHLCDPGGECDGGAHDGNKTSEEDGDAAVFVKEVLGAVEVVVVEQDEASVFGDEGSAAEGSDPVGDARAEVAADGSGKSYADQLQLAGVHEVAGE